MRAAEIAGFGRAAAVVRIAEVPDPPPPGPGEVMVAIEASPINPSDFTYIEGRYFRPVPLPFRPGSEAVGRILAVGPGVAGLGVGDRVLMLTVGNWVQRRTVPVRDVVRVPAELDPLQLAMLRVNPATAWLLLETVVELSAGDWVIQNAANSAVGTLVARFARERGLSTVNLVRRPEARGAVLAAGGTVVLEPGPDLAEAVRRATDGAPILLGLDAIGGQATAQLAACLDHGGVLATYGMLSGEPCRIAAGDLIGRELSLVGFRLRGLRSAGISLEQLYRGLAARLADGQRLGAVGLTFPLEAIAAALEAAAAPAAGKTLLLPNGSLQ